MKLVSILSLSLLLSSAVVSRAQEEGASAEKADKAFTVRKKLAGDAAGELKCDGKVQKNGEEVVLERCAKRNFDAYEAEAKKSGIVKDIREYDAAKHAKLAKTLAFYEKAAKKAEADFEDAEEKAIVEKSKEKAVEAKKQLAVLKKVHKTYKKALKECKKSKYHKVMKCPAAPKEPPAKPRSKCEPMMKCGAAPAAPAAPASAAPREGE